MKKFVMLAAILLATPATAGEWDGKASDTPISGRFEYVWIVSKTVCPTITAGNDGATVMDRAVSSYGLSTNERLILGDFCITYMQGVVDGLRRARELR